MKPAREPILHFLALGLVLFLIYSWTNERQGLSTQRIVVDQQRIDILSAAFERIWRRPPTPEEVRTLTTNWIREEVLYREGLANALDKNDPVVRRRVAQNMEFLLTAFVPETPSDSELQAWLDANSESYRSPARFSFRQVYVSPNRDAESLGAQLAAVRRQLEAGEPPLAADATLLPYELEGKPLSEVVAVFGERFANELTALSPGEWTGPIESDYGLHLVSIDRIDASRLPSLSSIRNVVEADYEYEKTTLAQEASYRALRSKYLVEMSADPVASEKRWRP